MPEFITRGGFTMIPLLVCSLLVWAVIFERLWKLRGFGNKMHEFHLQITNALLRKDYLHMKRICEEFSELPSAELVFLALERLGSPDAQVRQRWQEAVQRRRQRLNQDLRSNVWILGTIGSAAPFIGLFGTVVGILQSFQEIGRTGAGGFAVVAAGISEALVATAAGIVVAVIAVFAFNAFQTRWSTLIMTVRLNMEEIIEYLEDQRGSWISPEHAPGISVSASLASSLSSGVSLPSKPELGGSSGD